MGRIIKYTDYIIYWLIILIPSSMAVAPAPMNVFMGLLIFCFLLKKLLKQEKVFVQTPINIPLLLILIITCLSVFNSVNYGDSMKGGIFRLLQYILIFFIITQEVRDKKHIKRIIFSLALGIIFASLDGIFQVFTGKDLVRGYQPPIILGLARATASFKSPNLLGVYLSAFSPVVLGLTLFYYKRAKRVLFIIISFLALTGIILTYSRPTLLAIYVVLLIFGLVRKNKALIAFMLIIALISPFIAPRQVRVWAKQVDYNPLRFMCNDDRIAIYRHSLNMIRDHPIIGVGANTYMKNYKKYKESPEYRNVVTSDYVYAHNNFLHIAAEIGLIGLLVFLWLLYRIFKECARVYRRLREGYIRIVSLSLIACLIAFLVNGLTESSLYSARVAMSFWYIMGLALGLHKFVNHEDRQ